MKREYKPPKPKEKVLPLCAHCNKGIEKGDGGPIKVPLTITGYLTTETYLHNRCLNLYLRQQDERRRPFPDIGGGELEQYAERG